MKKPLFFFLMVSACVLIGAISLFSQNRTALIEQNESLFKTLQSVHHLTVKQIEDVRKIFARSGYIGQGNPSMTKHPVSIDQCEEKLKQAGVMYENPVFEKICGEKYMAPLYNPAVEHPEDACDCIDQFEFPDIPCIYPVVWVRAKEAAEICEAMGKRLCDAHEWEGACEGCLEPPDYRFDLAMGQTPEKAIQKMREAHNQKYKARKSWSYGPDYQKGICGSASEKSPG
ncbi:MAG: hypothetical protein KJ737_22480 [Proteobacteria bacterium]|nr:hypothetical protein [Pseudomonadota bacterium]